MFTLSNFILNGLKDAVGKMDDCRVILNAAGWHEKGVLTEDDLKTINDLIESKNAPADHVRGEPIEYTPGEPTEPVDEPNN